MRTAALTMFGMLLATTATTTHATEHVLLTAGVVKAVDHADRTVVLDSGVKLRVREVIVADQIADVAAIRVDDVIYVSGVLLTGDAGAQARVGAPAATQP